MHNQLCLLHQILLFLVTNQSRSHPNTEMTLIVDVDLDLLKELHEARKCILKDRRTDLNQKK
jgi:hypothetical protein